MSKWPPASFTVSCRVFSTVPWRQQSLDPRPFSRCAGTVGMLGRGRAAGLGLPGPDVSLCCLHLGSLSCGYPSHPPHRAHFHVPGAATEALWHQSANLTWPGTPGPCSVAVLSSLEEWEGNRLSLAWAHAGPQQDPVLSPLGLLAMPSDPALAPLKWHLCPTCYQALPTGSPIR